LIEAAMQTQKDVVVFCKNGRSRSPSVIAAFILLFGECLWTTSKLGLQRLILSNAQRQLEESSNFPNLDRFDAVLSR
jgi:protein-tyrosine phosphatase